MDNHSHAISQPAYINGLVAAILDDVVQPPVRREAMTRVIEIRRAVAEGSATIDMAIDIVALFPRSKAA